MAELLIHDRLIELQRRGAAPRRQELPQSSQRMSSEELAAAITALRSGDRDDGTDWTLRLPSSWAYVLALAVTEKRPSEAALGFALEEFLPLDIEQLTCAFQRVAAGQWLAAAVENAFLAPRLEALRGCGIDPLRITLDLPVAETGTGWRAWVDHDHIAVMSCDASGLLEPRVLRLCESLESPEALKRAGDWLREITIECGPGTLHGCVPVALLEALTTMVEAASVAASPAPNWSPLNLATGALASPRVAGNLLRATRRLALAACVALAVLIGGSLLRSYRLAESTAAIAAWETSLFKELFPGQPVGGAPGLRIAAELRRLRALAPLESGPDSRPPGALDTLQRVVAALPGSVRLDVQELRIEAGDVTLRGRTTDHAQAEKVGSALRNLPQLECDPPRTDRQSDGLVQFFLHAHAETSPRP